MDKLSIAAKQLTKQEKEKHLESLNQNKTKNEDWNWMLSTMRLKDIENTRETYLLNMLSPKKHII